MSLEIVGNSNGCLITNLLSNLDKKINFLIGLMNLTANNLKKKKREYKTRIHFSFLLKRSKKEKDLDQVKVRLVVGQL